VVSGQWLVVSG